MSWTSTRQKSQIKLSVKHMPKPSRNSDNRIRANNVPFFIILNKNVVHVKCFESMQNWMSFKLICMYRNFCLQHSKQRKSIIKFNAFYLNQKRFIRYPSQQYTLAQCSLNFAWKYYDSESKAFITWTKYLHILSSLFMNRSICKANVSIY